MVTHYSLQMTEAERFTLMALLVSTNNDHLAESGMRVLVNLIRKFGLLVGTKGSKMVHYTVYITEAERLLLVELLTSVEKHSDAPPAKIVEHLSEGGWESISSLIEKFATCDISSVRIV